MMNILRLQQISLQLIQDRARAEAIAAGMAREKAEAERKAADEAKQTKVGDISAVTPPYEPANIRPR